MFTSLYFKNTALYRSISLRKDCQIKIYLCKRLLRYWSPSQRKPCTDRVQFCGRTVPLLPLPYLLQSSCHKTTRNIQVYSTAWTRAVKRMAHMEHATCTKLHCGPAAWWEDMKWKCTGNGMTGGGQEESIFGGVDGYWNEWDPSSPPAKAPKSGTPVNTIFVTFANSQKQPWASSDWLISEKEKQQQHPLQGQLMFQREKRITQQFSKEQQRGFSVRLNSLSKFED